MHLVDALQAELEPVQASGAVGVRIQWLLDEKAGTPTFAMRRFIVEEDGQTPFHSHDWEHEVYVLEGTGVLVIEDEKHPLQPGLAVFIPGGEQHQFRASAEGPLEFLCLVPCGPATTS